MNNNREIRLIKAQLLTLLPQWNSRITRPFKLLLDEGISLEMYYCLQTLFWLGGSATMSELGKYMYLPKQQMTKLVNRLADQNLIERQSDPSDRRIIRIVLTEMASHYIDDFLDVNAGCFEDMLDEMTAEDRAAFLESITTITNIFAKLPCPCKPPED